MGGSGRYPYVSAEKKSFPLLEQIVEKLDISPRFVGCFLGHTFKNIEGRKKAGKEFTIERIYELFEFLKSSGIDYALAKQMLPTLFEHPKMDFESILTRIHFEKMEKSEIISKIQFLNEKFEAIRRSDEERDKQNWIMGQLRNIAIGNIQLKELADSLN